MANAAFAQGCGGELNQTTGQSNKVPAPESRTVKEAFDDEIAGHKQAIETLCIRKAKLDTLGMLDHPYEALNTMLSTYAGRMI